MEVPHQACAGGVSAPARTYHLRVPVVIVYYPEDPSRVYQLLQWLPVLDRLDREFPVAVVTRCQESTELIEALTRLPVRLAEGFDDLAALYADLDASVVLYCNNSHLNFNSLINTSMLHVHINHGESDKQSMVSNNAKAYDRVFVAGQAAVERHAAALMEFDLGKLVVVGRPQLDLEPEPILDPSPRRTVLYAPTWEGDADYNNYTSVDLFGPQIIASLLAVSDVRVVYKPHPKVLTSTASEIAGNHRLIVDTMMRAQATDPAAGHTVISAGDILAVMRRCDLMVTDVSSVGLDWLYLCTDKPIVITDRRNDPETLCAQVPVSRVADVVGSTSMHTLATLVADRLSHDEHQMARRVIRHHYFGPTAVGGSTARFIEEIGALVALRDAHLGRGTGPAEQPQRYADNPVSA
ncbi:CDP-glycerol glycerophosphotransferase family protein [soil metagenome]